MRAAGRRIAWMVVWAAPLVCGVRAGTTCPGDRPQYFHYTAQNVRIDSPLRFVTAATFDFDAIKAGLAGLTPPIKEGIPFDDRTFSPGVSAIREAVRARNANGSQKVKVVVATMRLENCDTSARTLDVVYRVFTFMSAPALSRTFEARTNASERPATTGAQEGTEARFLVLPEGGYNHTRHGYGGLKASAAAPLGPFQKLDLASSFSSAAQEVHFDLAGSANSSSAALQHAEWRLGFHYTDLPAGEAKLKEAKLAAQFSATTRELSEGGAVLRYGAALEGGHQQAGGAALLAVPNSAYGALKLYAGATRNWDRMAFTGSYAAQLASTLTGGGLDFSKHIADIGYSVRFLGMPKTNPERLKALGSLHRPLDIQARVTGGLIQGSGPIPAAERFFGGNQVHPFIAGDSWIINSDAFIRSIPENRLAALTLGGTRFYSGNLTISKVLGVGRALMPKELATTDFLDALKSGLETAEGTLRDSYKTKDPTFQVAQGAIADLESTAGSLKKTIDAIPADPAIDASLKPVRSGVNRLVRTVDQLKTTASVAGPLTDTQIPALAADLERFVPVLNGAGRSDVAKQLVALRAEMVSQREPLQKAIQSVDTERPKELARKDMSKARKVLDTVMYELNAYSVAPVAVFDVARVWPAEIGTRYAAGGGVRFSLVNLNLTVGYAANPKRRTGEGPGALFLTLEVMNLFH